MKVVVGLGNPGPKYVGTRHNIGFLVLRRLADQWSISFNKVMCQAKVGEGKVSGHPVRLAMPQTFMNSSGDAVSCLIKRWKLDPAMLLVVCDDVSLPLGMIRLRGRGSDGGHQGLASLLKESGTNEIPRLRIGIRSEPLGTDLTPYVLGRFRASEKRVVEESIHLAVRACETWVSQDLALAMNLFNKRKRVS